MPNTRQKILDTAKRLFNEKGFNSVSTQDIAHELGISKGNLTYYFHRKEEMIEAIINQWPRREATEAPANLESLDRHFRLMYDVVRENAFYFWHYAQMAQLSPSIKDAQREVYAMHRKILSEAFRLLFEAGLIREEDFSKEYERLIDALYLSIIYWLPFCELRQEKSIDYQTHAWGIMHNLLTERGRSGLKNL